MSNIKNRAVEACLEYDVAKRRIDDLTSKIHDRFTACEERQYDEGVHGGKVPITTIGVYEPCLNMGYDGWEASCEDCQKAYQLIQDRKEARQEFGIAKRKVRAVARTKRKAEANQ